MTTFDQFVVTDGSVTAESADGEQVTFDAALADRDDITPGWEPLVVDWLQAGDGSLSFAADGSAALSRDRVLSATETSSAVGVGDRRGAAAVLAYLAHEGVVETDGDSVTFLRPFEQGAETHTSVYDNWAAVLGVLVERLDLLVSRLEAVRSVGEKQGDTAVVVSTDVDTIVEVVERLDVVGGVLAERRAEFRQLAVGSTVSPESLAESSDQFTTLVESSLDGFPTVAELATTADATVTEAARHVAEQVGESLSSVSNTFSPTEKMDERDLDEFIDEIAAGMDTDVDDTTGDVSDSD